MRGFSYLSAPIAVWLAAIGLVFGCGSTEHTVDGGPEPDAGGPAGQLFIESMSTLTLTVGEVAPIEIRYTEEGRGRPGQMVRFALEGSAHDSAVADLSLATDAEGRASTMVTAGTVTSIFRVRVSADRAAAAYVNVSVGPEGFGMLRVTAVYQGRRAEAARRVIRVYAGTECDPVDGYPAFPDRTATIDDPEEQAVRWSLPVGLTYTIVGEVRGPGGETLAIGCEDGVELSPDTETDVTLALADASLVPEGRYDLELEVFAAAATDAVIGQAIDAGLDLLADGAPARYLDALDAELRDRGEVAAAEALALERLGGEPERQLGAALDAASVGPGEALSRLEARLAARLSVVRVGGPLALARSADTLGGAWAADRLEIGLRDPDSPPPTVLDAPALGVTLMPTLSLAWRARMDLIDVEALTLSLPLATLVDAQVADWLLEVAQPGALLEDGAGCEVLAVWVEENATVGPACDAGCAQAACLRALDGLVPPVREALDLARDALSVGGTVAASDDDGDLRVDRIEGRGLTGTWASAALPAESDAITADLIGARALE